MDAELERLRQENACLRRDRDGILAERNQYLARIQQERTRNTEMSNQLLALDSAINDLKRTNQDLSEKLELALSAQAIQTASRALTPSSDRPTPVKTKRIPRLTVSVEIPILAKSKPRPFRIARTRAMVMSGAEAEESFVQEMKVETPSPTRAEEQPPLHEGSPLERSDLGESDNDDPFAHDFELLQRDQLPEQSVSDQSSSTPGEDAVDAPRTLGGLKRKRIDEEEEGIPTPVPSFRVIRSPGSFSVSAPLCRPLPHRSKPKPQPPLSRARSSKHARRAIKKAQPESEEEEEEEHSDEDEEEEAEFSNEEEEEEEEEYSVGDEEEEEAYSDKDEDEDDGKGGVIKMSLRTRKAKISQDVPVPRKRGRQPNSSLKRRKRCRPPKSSLKRQKPGNRYPCPIPGCTRTFTRSDHVQRHVKSSGAHPEIKIVDESKRCKYCGMDLSRADARLRHERTNACGRRNRRKEAEMAAEEARVKSS